jgi:hypothetical protein
MRREQNYMKNQIETQFTPGPWQIVENSFAKWVTNSVGKAQIAKAFHPAGMAQETFDANLKLVAAAPDLASALRRLLDERYHCDDEPEFDQDGNFTCNSPASVAAREALAKAGC